MSPFKAYDIRGLYGSEVTEELAYRIGRHLPSLLGGNRAIVGRDARLSSPSLAEALLRGLADSGCAADDMGLSSTPMVYFATAEFDYDFSIQVTASHNPAEYNGFKISRRGAIPVGGDSGLADLERLCAGPTPPPVATPGKITHRDCLPAFLSFLRPYADGINGLKMVIDCSNGMGALTAHALFDDTGATFISDAIDGSFPGHPPNPLEAAGRAPLSAAVRAAGADLGLVFDGDADRVMFVDEHGEFVRPDLLIAPMAERYLREFPGATILHDIRTSRGTTERIEALGGHPFIWKVGHAFAKMKLRELNSPFGGEFAGHYYFRDFHWCDSGELAALVALREIAAAKARGVTFSQMMAPLARYANSGELNFRINDKDAAMARAVSALTQEAAPTRRLDFDGVRLDYPDWWLSLRKSNTEPYLRLIVEATSPALLAERLARVKGLIL